ncbi:MAG: serine hydrolase [Balneolaceae bacterium]|nr:serine hydrolase [Balneolaceae bacterium]
MLIVVLILCKSSLLFAQNPTAINQQVLESLIAFSEETYTDEFMLIQKNETLIHWKNPSCDAPQFNTASMVKSWTGLVIGSLVDKGFIESVDDTVCTYLPNWEIGCREDITIKQLLTMSAGYNRRPGASGILAQQDMNEYVLNTEPDTLQDVRFSYSNESVQLLGLLIEEITGMNANEAFIQHLFEPLGMDSTQLGKDEAGNYMVFGGAKTTLQDASKVGLLMANKGMVDGKQMISREWIEQSTSTSDKAGYYGYLWWLDNNSENKNFAAMGDFGQLTILFPDLDLVYLRQQTCNKEVSGNMPWMGPELLNLISATIQTDE